MVVSNRISVYVGEQMLSALSNREREGEGLSGLVNSIVDRYWRCCERSMPELKLGEWCCIFDALNGCWMQEFAESLPTYLIAEVADHIKLNGAAQKWAINGEALLGKLVALDYAQAMAVWDAAERFWRDKSNDPPGVLVPDIVGDEHVVG